MYLYNLWMNESVHQLEEGRVVPSHDILRSSKVICSHYLRHCVISMVTQVLKCSTFGSAVMTCYNIRRGRIEYLMPDANLTKWGLEWGRVVKEG